MGSVEYSEYPVSYQPTFSCASRNDKTEKKETPVIEGIANFCELNRSYANQNTQGWNNLQNAISNTNSQTSSASAANKTNTLLQTSAGVSVQTIRDTYKYTCGDIRGKIFKQDGITISPNGSVYAYSPDFKVQRGSTSVNSNGEFNGLNVKLTSETEKFVFTYEDATGKMWSLDIKSGSGSAAGALCSANNKYYELKHATPKRFGDYANQSRDPNGKLINTEQKNSGAELRYNGMKAIYAETIANTMNLGIGVLAAIVFIAKTQ